jgi:hypothetical protein
MVVGSTARYLILIIDKHDVSRTPRSGWLVTVCLCLPTRNKDRALLVFYTCLNNVSVIS